ncbi:MAG: hypothetical protein WCA35_05090 [Kovacikia sp.]
MSTPSNQRFVRKATALLSAIAASSFLGLPVLAQTSPGAGNSSVQCVPGSTQSRGSDSSPSISSNTPSSNTPSSNPSNNSAIVSGSQVDSMQSEANPRAMPSQANGMNSRTSLNQSTQSSRQNTSTSAADDSNTPGVQEYPNQSDPRTGVSPSPNTGATYSTNNRDVTAGTTSAPTDQSANSNGPRSGDVPSGNSISRARTETTQGEVQSVMPVGPQGQAGTTSSVNQPVTTSMANSNSGNYRSSSNDVYQVGASSLAQANATSGAQAARLLTQGMRNQGTDQSSDRMSYGYGQAQSPSAMSGVTSGAQTTNQGQIMARCPEGMVPSYQSVPGAMNRDQNQAAPDRNSIPRERTAPDVQTPGR